MLVQKFPGVLIKLPLFVIIALFIGFLFPVLQSPVNLYSSFTDDFYYYLKIADSCTSGLGLCFAPHIYTNGYQPFFQFFIVALVFVSRLLHVPELVFIRLVLAFVFTGGSLLLYREAKPVTLPQILFFILGLFSYYFIGNSGMESVFIVPVLAIYILRLSTNRLTLYQAAVLVVAAFFVRIDSFVITLPLFFYLLWKSKVMLSLSKGDRRGTIEMLVSFFIMGLPVAIYLAANYMAYHTLFPVSGLAKSVLKVGGINPAAFKSFIHYYPYSFYNVVILCLFGLVLITLNIREKIYFYLLVLTTILFYLQTAIRSDWGLWAWYFYPTPTMAFLMAAQGKTLFAAPHMRFPRFNRAVYATASAFTSVVVVFAFVVFVFYTFPINRPTAPMGQGRVDVLHVAGVLVRQFEARHTGVYAMGDRAGIVGYLIHSPLIQLEGLVMDKNYMSRLSLAAREGNLDTLLHSYHVNYYIASNPKRINDSTWVVTEPFQSNGLSPQITDTISWPVCRSFTLSTKGVFTGKPYDPYQTIIFKVPDN